MNLRRLSEEVRAACRSVTSVPSPSSASGPALAHRAVLGEWLGAVRQPRGEFAGLAARSRRRFPADEAIGRGDLSRTHIMRLKGERADLEDGLDRSRRFLR